MTTSISKETLISGISVNFNHARIRQTKLSENAGVWQGKTVSHWLGSPAGKKAQEVVFKKLQTMSPDQLMNHWTNDKLVVGLFEKALANKKL